MRCTNCGNVVSDAAKVCGYCGHRLKAAPIPIAAQSGQPTPVVPSGGTPSWVWGLLGSMVVLAGIFLVVVFAMLRPKAPASAAPVIDPPRVASLPTEKVNTPVVRASPTPTQEPPTPTPTNTHQRCDLFTGMQVSIIWLDIPKGSTQAQIVVKMPGGVPGLENKIYEDTRSWVYELKIGDYRTTGCHILTDYPARLYCDFPMPTGYAASIRPIELHVNNCTQPIFTDPRGELPAIQEAKGKGRGSAAGSGPVAPACAAGLDAASCAAAGGTFSIMPGFCDPGPCPSSCTCP